MPREYIGKCISKVVLADLLQGTDQLATGRLYHCSLLDTGFSLTVRQEKVVGSKGKQPCKHRASETQTNQWSATQNNKVAEIGWK